MRPLLECSKTVVDYMLIYACKGRGYKISFQSPKTEKLALFRHGQRTFDHIILLPPKSKGKSPFIL